MFAEWLLVGLLLGVLLFATLRRCRSKFIVVLILAGAVATTAGAMFWQGHIRQTAETRNKLQKISPRQGRPEEFVGSENCRSCHPSQYESWHRSYHRTMTQVASPQSVRGTFKDVDLFARGEDYHLSRRGDEFWVNMIDPDWSYSRAIDEYKFKTGKISRPPRPEPNPPRVDKQVTMVTGSHHMQAYWVPGKYGNHQFNFPFTFLFEEQRWVPRDDVFLRDPHADRSFQTWNLNCLICHTTAPQAKQDPDNYAFDTRVAEFGISCEACHGPAKDHVSRNADPLRRYGLHKKAAGDDSIVNPSRLTSQKSAEVCSQCHAVRYNVRKDWHETGPRYRPGQDGILEQDSPLVRPEDATERRGDLLVTTNSHEILRGSFWADGMVRVSGREFNGLAYTACFTRGKMSCLSCHSMHHNIDSDDQLAIGMDGNQACAQCHGDYQKNLAAHTRHSAGSSGSQCYNCHMPHTTYGLLKAIRSHQITSPSVKVSLDTGRPNACNLCHLDKSLGWTAGYLETWYKKPKPPMTQDEKTISAGALWALKGDAGQRAIIAWHMGWNPAKSASGSAWLPPYLAQLLEDPYSVVRYIAQRSLKRLSGYENFDYDYIAPAETRAQAHKTALKLWKPGARQEQAAALLLEPQGTVRRAEFQRLMSQRDDHIMDLLE